MAGSGSAKARKEQLYIRFADAYIATGENALQAYLQVKPHVATSTAGVEGHRLLKIPKVLKLIEKRREELRRKFSITTDRIMQEQARLCYFNPKDMVDAEGNEIPLHKLSDDTAAALASVEVTTVTVKGSGKDRIVTKKVTKAKPYNKVTAIEKSIRILRLYDKPPPPPPETPEAVFQDPKDTARRMAFLLARGAAVPGAKPAEKAEAKPQAKPKKIRLSA